MDIQYLDPNGINPFEVKAHNKLRKALPDSWKAYASLEILGVQKGVAPEIDLVIVAPDRIILVDLKEWNNTITSKNGNWISAGHTHPSPVRKINYNAKLLLQKIQKHAYKLPQKKPPFIMGCVVLCGTAGKEKLSEEEQAKVFTCDEFAQIGKQEVRDELLGQVYTKFANREERPNAYLAFWDKFFSTDSNDFAPRAYTFSQYKQVGRPLFKHRNGIYKEFESVHVENKSYRALMRRWDFLASDINDLGIDPKKRKEIANREFNVLGYLDQFGDRDVEESHLKIKMVPSAGDIPLDFCELYDWPKNKMRLDDFMARNNALSIETKIPLMEKVLLNLSKIHELNVAHRDLGIHSIWMALPAEVIFSNFLSSTYPDNKGISVNNLRGLLSNNSSSLPEDVYDDPNGTPFSRDIYQIGAVIHYIAYGSYPAKNTDGFYIIDAQEESKLSQKLYGWMKTALSEDATKRFKNATDALESFVDVVKGDFESKLSVKTNFIENLITDINPYLDFKIGEMISQNGNASTYKDTEGYHVIKIWSGANLYNPDKTPKVRAINFLENIESLKESKLNCTPEIVDFGYSQLTSSIYLRYKWINWATWESWSEVATDIDLVHPVAQKLLKSVGELHDHGFSHLDMQPKNIIVNEDENKLVFIDLFGSPGQHIEETPAYLPENHEALSDASNNRFAAIKLIHELYEKLGEVAITLQTEQLLEKTEIISKDVEDFQETLEKIINPVEEVQTPIFTIKSKFFENEHELLADNGVFYVHFRIQNNRKGKDPQLKITITGRLEQLELSFNEKSLAFEHARIKEIDQARFISNKRSCHLSLEAKISIESNHFLACEALPELLFTRPEYKDFIAPEVDNSKYNGELSSKELAIETKEIWKALMDTEEDAHPKIEVQGNIFEKGESRELCFKYTSASTFEFDLKTDEIQLKRKVGGKSTQIAKVIDYDGNLMTILRTRGSFANTIKAGDSFTLVSTLSQSSIHKRHKAITNIIQQKCVIKNLTRYFNPTLNLPPEDYGVVVSDAELDIYSEVDENGKFIKGLNESQRKAFKNLYRYGPVGLLQGPPGTGKTSFISSFIHYLISKGEKHILLVSQSHEAVDNAAHKVRTLFRENNIELDIVRLGDERQVSSELRDVQEDSLREAFRSKFQAEFKQRFLSLSKVFGIKEAYLKEIIEFEKFLGITLERLIFLKKNKSSSSEIKRKCDKTEQLFEEKFEAFCDGKELKFPQQDTPIDKIRDRIYELLAQKHEVHNENTVDRVKKTFLLTKEFIDTLSNSKAKFQDFLVRSRSLVCGTCVGIARNHYELEQNTFDWVIIDEAARSTASELSIAMQVGKRILLVGDHKQLAPMYEEEHIKSALSELRGITEEQLVRSDFEKAFLSGYGQNIGQTLSVQYRMVEPIGNLVSDCFYDGFLSTGKTSGESYFNELPKQFGGTVTWVDTSDAGSNAYEKKVGNTYQNKYESDSILKLVEELSSQEEFYEELKTKSDKEVPIGIICMYKAQKTVLLRSLYETSWGKNMIQQGMLKVDTVDSYQGKENEIIILSLVRSNKRQKSGFLANEQRLNVALSRAKERLYIFGNTDMWAKKNNKTPIEKVLNYIQSNKDSDYQIIPSTSFLKGDTHE
ncbi:AAA domain-containing protein [Thiomicrorhabdus sp.]|uniref:AAA domain-containing protein n=1 Tax=Thiomicrorhabdus sp. TaxID=2039724 RepID=UPI0029C7282C|nr:AAA domain-containing protein [Thiomicrorhabdus sp.]